MDLFKKKDIKTENSANGATSDNAKDSRMQAKRKINKRNLANGSLAVVTAVVMIAVIVVANMIVSALSSDAISFDMSTNKIFTIGDTTKDVLASLGEDVTLHFLIQPGQEDTRIERLLDSYESASDHVKVEKTDIVANPTFYQEYSDTAISPNSVVVTSGSKSKVIENSFIYVTDYATYEYSFDGEGQLTSAIAYVAGSDTSAAYTVTGHNEIPLSADMTDLLEKANITASDLNLLSSEIPGDCDLLIIFAPASDFTSDEAKKVISFLHDGGKALIVTVTQDADTPNFDSILDAYGISRIPGFVVEGNANHYTQAPYILLPEIMSTDVTEKVAGLNVVDAFAQAINISTDDDDLAYTATPLLATSSEGYVKALDTQSLEKAEGDIEGTLTLAVKVEETVGSESYGNPDVDLDGDGSSADEASANADDGGQAADNADASGKADGGSAAEGTSDEQSGADNDEEGGETKHMKMLYYSSPCLFSSDALSSLLQMYVEMPEGNMTLFSESITYLTDREVTVSIPSKSMQEPSITVAQGAASAIGRVLMYGLPAAVLVYGIAITLIRRRK